jgi:hypothetical protein
MGDARAVRSGFGLALLSLLAPLAAGLVHEARAPQEDDARTCLVCHDDAGLESSSGRPVYVGARAFAASVHGRAGAGCVGCHADLRGFADFPHAPDLASVACASCHGDYARTSLGGVHGISSPILAKRPVLCKDCHGYHDALPSSEPGSSVHASNRPATCARCHPGAGRNYARGRVHEHPASGRPTAAGVVRVLYNVLTGALTAAVLFAAAVDLLRSRRGR